MTELDELRQMNRDNWSFLGSKAWFPNVYACNRQNCPSWLEEKKCYGHRIFQPKGSGHGACSFFQRFTHEKYSRDYKIVLDKKLFEIN